MHYKNHHSRTNKSIEFLVKLKNSFTQTNLYDHKNKTSTNKTPGSDNGWTDRFFNGLLHFGQLPGRLALLLLFLFDLLLDPLPLPVLPLRLTRLLLQLISQLVNLSLVMVQLKELQLKLLLCLQYSKHKCA